MGIVSSSDAMTADPNIGRLLSNRYRLVELVGKGAMGRVYRAEDVLLGGVVAVKFLAQTLLNSKMRDRFFHEARTCAQLGQKSIHIVSVTHYDVSEDVPFYVMEYLQGYSLSEIINCQLLTLPRFLSMTRQICLGLQCAHEGIKVDGKTCPIIHRDIKPSNILVKEDKSLGELVKILDFGIAKLIQEDSGQTNSFMGTLAYSSPEQMEGRELDARSDIYSLGVMMFEMLTGKMPLQAETHSFGSWYKAHHFQPPRAFASVNPGLKLPKALETLVMGCLAKTPPERPQSIAEVLRALEPLEQRYSANRQISQRIGEALSKRTLSDETKQTAAASPVPSAPASVTQACQRATWPVNKPPAQIVFAQPFTVGQTTVPTVWVMLPEAEIQNFQIHQLYNRIYKNCLAAAPPAHHPMVLWVTGIYNPSMKGERGPRFLRCYLDLKNSQGQEMARLLGHQGEYYVLLFALEKPQTCSHVMKLALSNGLRLQLQELLVKSQHQQSSSRSSMSKELLTEEFERMKPRIIQDMESVSHS